MDKRFKIPNEVIKYTEGSDPKDVDGSNGLRYEISDIEKIDVLFWNRYPNYDFIFGVPEKDSSAYEKELAFLLFRDSRKNQKGVISMYFDISETKGMIRGLEKCLKFSKKHSPHLWKNTKTKLKIYDFLRKFMVGLKRI